MLKMRVLGLFIAGECPANMLLTTARGARVELASVPVSVR